MSLSAISEAHEDVIHNEPVSLSEVQARVAKLCALPLPISEDPEFQPRPGAVHYVPDLDTRFRDRDGFVSSLSKPLEEAAQLEQLIALMENAEKFSCLLYTWRGCNLALPQLTQPEQHAVAVEVLEPEIQKLRDFLAFQKDAVGKFKLEINQLVQARAKSGHISETRLLTVGRVIASLASLDEIKNIKASVVNDYAYYKRAIERSQKRDATTILEMQEMNMFLATHDVILNQIKLSLGQIAGFEDVLCGIINTSVSWLEEHKYVTPKEKYGLVKVIGYSLYLIDGEKVNINKLHKKGKINLTKIDSIFKDMEVVPLFGDQMIGPFRYIERTPNFDSSHWEKCRSSDQSKQSRLLENMAAYRQSFSHLVGEITLALNAAGKKSTKYAELPDGNVDRKLTREECCNLCRITEKCLRALSTWTSNICELFSWKLLHPVDPEEKGVDCPASADHYERATRYNYNAQEKTALVELIGMIKSLQSLLARHEQVLQRALHLHMYAELQTFLIGPLEEALKKATKKTKSIIISTLNAVQNVSLDACDNKVGSETVSKSPSKMVRASSTQIFLVRTMIESLVTKSEGFKSQRKELESSNLKSMEAFLHSSFFWPYFVSLKATLDDCCDLSQLWYREFFLEMTKGEKIQFPIEMSFPWILADHILERRDPILLQYVLYPLDLYNDAARCALTKFKKQFLFDEAEAEAKLCFDQFVYKLSEQIYEQYKNIAANSLLNKSFRIQCKKMGIQIAPIKRINYVPLMNQRTIQLLGRSVDLSRLLSQYLNDYFLKSLGVAISRFETSDLTFVMYLFNVCSELFDNLKKEHEESRSNLFSTWKSVIVMDTIIGPIGDLECLITLNRETHKLLSAHLRLDDFDALLNEANYSVRSPWGRIAQYILLELDRFFMPHFCYNATTNRFVKTTYAFGEEVERERQPNVSACHLWGGKVLNTYYAAIFSRYREFIGPPHFNAICSVLNYQEVAFLVSETGQLIKQLINGTLLPYCEALQKVMPKRAALPRYDYTAAGVKKMFHALLMDILSYADLKPKVFQCLREIGNGILFVMQLEIALSQKEVIAYSLSSLFLSVIPKPNLTPPKDETEETKNLKRKKFEELEAKYKNYNTLQLIQAKGSEEQVARCKENALLSKEKLSFGLVLFKQFLLNLSQYLNSNPLWKTLKTKDGAWHVDVNAEFHRLWSAMMFICCYPPSAHELTIEELFGESLNWAGCTLVVLLGQQRRYEAMDFCNHLHKVHKVDKPTPNSTDTSLRNMIERIRKFQTLNDQIFSQLNKHLLPSNPKCLHNTHLVQIEHFQPPTPPK